MTYGTRLHSLMDGDDRIVVLTAENWGPIVPIGLSGHPRFIDTGINEQALVGIASGLAVRGRVPFVHALSSFLTMRAFEFIRTDVGVGHLPVKLVGSLGGFLSEGNGPTHQAVEDVALLRLIPQMRVFCPASMQELEEALPVVLESPHPWYIRYIDRTTTAAIERVTEEGRAAFIGDGCDVGIIANGLMLEHAWQALTWLAARGIHGTLMHARFVAPFDRRALEELSSQCRCLVTIEDHLLTGGLGEVVASELTLLRRDRPLLRIALEDWFSPGPLDAILESTGMTGPSLGARIAHWIDAGTPAT